VPKVGYGADNTRLHAKVYRNNACKFLLVLNCADVTEVPVDSDGIGSAKGGRFITHSIFRKSGDHFSREGATTYEIQSAFRIRSNRNARWQLETWSSRAAAARLLRDQCLRRACRRRGHLRISPSRRPARADRCPRAASRELDGNLARGRSADRIRPRLACRHDDERTRRNIELDAAGSRSPRHRTELCRTRGHGRRGGGRDPITGRLLAVQSGGTREPSSASLDFCRRYSRPVKRRSGCLRHGSKSWRCKSAARSRRRASKMPKELCKPSAISRH